MKQLTEAQVQAFRCAMLPPSRHPYPLDHAPSTIDRSEARHSTSARRAIEEYHAQRALRIEMEL
ncbi:MULTISPECIES: PA3496 family putative envelope integrity protein [Aeromonas]|uniref:PA3496 family putative envelope integrity protein n=1 Tax=Aeromonas TaxID=642 RepID=UPI0002806D14|nr:hypothetical protein [Aeromonas veronii]EKB22410.1 hypothetical protein HMPREF1170_02672 [Aeromonas veronii AMC35]TNJ03929.1 hypothetical protein CF117_10085 [Aeromonas veronii]